MGKKHVTLPLVSIIIPVYNAKEYLDDAIQSVVNQDYENVDVILIDDGSTDGSAVICDKYANEYDSVRVFHKKNGGSSSARNTGLDQASSKSKYLLFFDSDDVMVKSTIRNLVKIAEETQADIILPDRYYKFTDNIDNGRLVRHFPKSMHTDCCRDFATNVLIDQGRAWRAHSLLYNHEIIRKNNLKFQEGIIAEDFFFNLDVLRNAESLKVIEHPTVNYRVRKCSVSHSFNRNYENIIWMMDDYVKKYYKSINEPEDSINRYSLLKRNVVTYLTSIMSESNRMNAKEKEQFAKKFLDQFEVKKAFSMRTSLPFYNNRMAKYYFALQYFCLKHRKINSAIGLAKLKNMVLG